MPWAYVVSDLKVEEIAGMFNKKELKKINKKDFRVEKVINRKDEKLKCYDNSFNNWIDKKDIV